MRSSRAQKERVVEQFRIRSIQEATLRMVASRGLTGATIATIAREAGVAKGTVYLYFRDRTDLIKRTAQFVASQVLSELERILAEPRPFREQLRRLLLTPIESLDRNQSIFRAYLELRNAEGIDRSHCRRGAHAAQIETWREGLTKVFRAAMRRGEVRRMDPARLVLFLSEGTLAVMRRRVSENPPPPVAKDVDWMVEALLHGVVGKRRMA